ncbi:PREDICTED: CST complex subunit CTC1 [Eurypyga helias]|uniref:CST complex subunit CTC1 n=1 Tax=Eurypyga helias TaxID=54383 RepID=UPI000528FE26|nr:PREDICTED: CST complex subunit CTC1 [Eurypyga helias]
MRGKFRQGLPPSRPVPSRPVAPCRALLQPRAGAGGILPGAQQGGCTEANAARWCAMSAPDAGSGRDVVKDGVRCSPQTLQTEFFLHPSIFLLFFFFSSFVSISDLQHQQCMPCCSHLTWSTNEFKEWAHQGQGALPSQSALPRTYLILVGYLTDGRQENKEKLVDGCLYLKDNTGIIPCELLHFELEWLESLFLFPSWSYIPQTDQSAAGYVEILADPVPVNLPKEVPHSIPVTYPASAEPLLTSRLPCKKRSKLTVAGELTRLGPPLCIHHKTFFFLFLKCFTSAVCVPVLVQKPNQLVWHHVLQLGHRYTVTGLSMSSLKKSGQRVFVTSVSSCLLPYCAEQAREQPLGSAWQGESTQSSFPETAEQQLSDSSELGVEVEMPRSTKESKIISYVGTVTKVLNIQAGLFLLDNKVCLCLAYQQLLNSARGLRPGACVELIDVHLLQKPLVSFPFIVLGACLSSTVVLKSFSRLSTPYHPTASSGNLYLQLLFRYNLGMPLYLWLVSLLETFEERFSCFFGHRQLLLSSTHRNPGAAENFLVPLLQAVMPDREQARDIYSEMLATIHRCPLHKYLTLNPPCQAPSLSAVCRLAERKSWEGFSPSQLLSPLEAQHMGTQELNRRLAWSCCTFSAGRFQPRLILLGVLRVSSRSSSLQLQDGSGTLPCVICHKDGSPFANTALRGSLLQVENYQLVVERFLQTDFPSWKQLANLEHMREKKASVYVQFYFEDIQVLHADERQIQKGLRSGNCSSLRKKDDGSLSFELETPEAKMLKLEDSKPDTHSNESCQEGQSSTRRTSCVSHLFLVTQKEGLMLRNYQLSREGDGEGQELQCSFQATVLWLGRPQLWSQPREIENMPELETSCDGEEDMTRQEALLLFMGKSLRWFPFLHLDGLYRFIVPHCSDLEVFDKLCFPPLPPKILSRSSCPLCLPVQDTWHLQHETWLSCLTERQLAARLVLAGMEQRISSIPEVLSNSFTGSLVSFSGEIVERTLCASPRNEKAPMTVGLQKQKGSLLASDHSVKLRVSAAPDSPVVLDVYIAATYLQRLWGLLPGAKILFQNLERKISRFRNVYCTYIASSCVSILSLPASPLSLPSSPAGKDSSLPLVFLSNLQAPLQHLPQARILCHLSCVLTLSLQWVCSLCSSIFKEGRCTRHSPPCPSHIGVRQASARVLVEDGTGEALVLCRNQHVAAVLGVSLLDWEALQNCVQSRGSVFIQYGEPTGTGCVEEPEDFVACYLRSLCRSPLICRPILLDFSLDRKPSKILQPAPLQLRNFRCGEAEFVSQVGPRLSLLCLNVEEVEQDAFSYLSRERVWRMSAHCRVGATA